MIRDRLFPPWSRIFESVAFSRLIESLTHDRTFSTCRNKVGLTNSQNTGQVLWSAQVRLGYDQKYRATKAIMTEFIYCQDFSRLSIFASTPTVLCQLVCVCVRKIENLPKIKWLVVM